MSLVILYVFLLFTLFDINKCRKVKNNQCVDTCRDNGHVHAIAIGQNAEYSNLNER